jgi:ATP-dependent Clp protease ATP-binding subunit ClpB
LRHNISLEISSEAATLLGDLGYDPMYGARPLKRVVQNQLIDRLATGMLDGSIREGNAVRVTAHDGAIVFETSLAVAA